jgi:hypothetical protein
MLVDDIGAEEVVAKLVAGCLFLVVISIGHRTIAPSDTRPPDTMPAGGRRAGAVA